MKIRAAFHFSFSKRYIAVIAKITLHLLPLIRIRILHIKPGQNRCEKSSSPDTDLSPASRKDGKTRIVFQNAFHRSVRKLQNNSQHTDNFHIPFYEASGKISSNFKAS